MIRILDRVDKMIDEKENLLKEKEKELTKELFSEYEEQEIEDETDNVIVVDEDEIVDRPSTKVQYNGHSYFAIIPKKIIKETKLAKQDELEWEVEAVNGEMYIKCYINESGKFKLPIEERVGGR